MELRLLLTTARALIKVLPDLHLDLFLNSVMVEWLLIQVVVGCGRPVR